MVLVSGMISQEDRYRYLETFATITYCQNVIVSNMGGVKALSVSSTWLPFRKASLGFVRRDDTMMFMNSLGKMSCQLGTHRGDINTWVWNCGESFHRWNGNKVSLDSFAQAMSQDLGSLSKMGTCWYAALILELGKQFNSSRMPSSTTSSSSSSSSKWVALKDFRCPVSKCKSWESHSWVCDEDGSSMFVNAQGEMKCENGTHKADICRWGWSCGESCHRGNDDPTSEAGFANALGLDKQAMRELGTGGVKSLIAALEKQFNSSGRSDTVIYSTRPG